MGQNFYFCHVLLVISHQPLVETTNTVLKHPFYQTPYRKLLHSYLSAYWQAITKDLLDYALENNARVLPQHVYS